MLKQYRHLAGGIFRIVDAFVIGSAWLAAYVLRSHVTMIAWTKELPPFDKYAALCPLVIAIWLTVFSSMRVYSMPRLLRRTDEIYLLLKAHMVTILIFIALTYLFVEYK